MGRGYGSQTSGPILQQTRSSRPLWWGCKKAASQYVGRTAAEMVPTCSPPQSASAPQHSNTCQDTDSPRCTQRPPQDAHQVLQFSELLPTQASQSQVLFLLLLVGSSSSGARTLLHKELLVLVEQQAVQHPCCQLLIHHAMTYSENPAKCKTKKITAAGDESPKAVSLVTGQVCTLNTLTFVYNMESDTREDLT